jgi:hypothetical protein
MGGGPCGDALGSPNVLDSSSRVGDGTRSPAESGHEPFYLPAALYLRRGVEVFSVSDLPQMSIDDVDFDFENLPAKIVASQSIQDLQVAGVEVGPIAEGQELDTRYWVASHLVAAGLASFRDDEMMTFNVLYKTHWKETKLQLGRRISSLPEYFYPRLRRYLRQLKEKASMDAMWASEYTNALRLAHDVTNCRLKKIVSLSASSAQTEDLLQNLSSEERLLYERLHAMVSTWRSKIS